MQRTNFLTLPPKEHVRNYVLFVSSKRRTLLDLEVLPHVVHSSLSTTKHCKSKYVCSIYTGGLTDN